MEMACGRGRFVDVVVWFGCQTSCFDTNFDASVGVADLANMLTVYGQDCEPDRFIVLRFFCRKGLSTAFVDNASCQPLVVLIDWMRPRILTSIGCITSPGPRSVKFSY